MEETKKKIFIASKKLFEEYSPKKVSIDMIVNEAGVGKGTFYNYFKNKEDVYEQIVDSYIDENHLEKKQKHTLHLSIKKQFVLLFLGTALAAFDDKIIHNFFLKNKNYFVGKIDFEYLRTAHIGVVQNMFRDIITHKQLLVLSELIWMYTKEMIQREKDLVKEELFEYMYRYANILVEGFFSNEVDAISKEDLLEMKNVLQLQKKL